MLEKYSSLSTRNFRLQSHELNLQQQKYENLGYQKAVRNNRLFFTIILSTWKKFHAKMNLLEARISRRFPNECWDLENFDKINLPTKLEICIIDNIMYVSGNNLWKKKIMNIKIGREI